MSKTSGALDRNWEAAKIDLVTAANKAGIDPSIMAKMAGLESAYDATARPISRDASRNKVAQYDGVNAISSAHGYGQLTNDTWTNMLQRYGEKYGVKGASHLSSAEANTAQYREDNALQAGMFAELTRENIAAVAGKGGDDISTNIYAYHNLGQGTGAIFLNAVQSNPNERVDDVLSEDVIKGNSALYGDGSVSVSAAYQKMTDTLSIYDKYAQEVQHTLPNSQSSPERAGGAPHGLPDHQALRQGARGHDVGELQNQLNSLCYTDARNESLRIDNDFGASTKTAVEAFQRDNHLAPDGIVGPATREAIVEQLKT